MSLVQKLLVRMLSIKENEVLCIVVAFVIVSKTHY
jgi:hypothetical protein